METGNHHWQHSPAAAADTTVPLVDGRIVSQQTDALASLRNELADLKLQAQREFGLTREQAASGAAAVKGGGATSSASSSSSSGGTTTTITGNNNNSNSTSNTVNNVNNVLINNISPVVGRTWDRLGNYVVDSASDASYDRTSIAASITSASTSASMNPTLSGSRKRPLTTVLKDPETAQDKKRRRVVIGDKDDYDE